MRSRERVLRGDTTSCTGQCRDIADRKYNTAGPILSSNRYYFMFVILLHEVKGEGPQRDTYSCTGQWRDIADTKYRA